MSVSLPVFPNSVSPSGAVSSFVIVAMPEPFVIAAPVALVSCRKKDSFDSKEKSPLTVTETFCVPPPGPKVNVLATAV